MKKILLIHSIQNNPITKIITQAAQDVLEENLASFETYSTSALLEIPTLISIISEQSDYGGIVITGAVTSERDKLLFPNLYQVCLDAASVYSVPIGFGIYIGDYNPKEQDLAVIGADAACSCVELANLNMNDLYSDLVKEAKYQN